MKKALALIGALALLCAAATAAAAPGGKGRSVPFAFRGELKSVSSSSLTMAVEGGSRNALRLMLGQSQNQSFTVGDRTEFLLWTKGIPKVVGPGDLKAGDWVQVTVRGERGSSLGELEQTQAGIVGDHVTQPQPPDHPLYLYRGTVDGPQSGGRVALHVRGGNARALRLLVGQPADQTFAYDDGTIFLLWQGKVPTVIDPSQLRAGDHVTIRIRAPFRASLSQVESTPASHVGDHEPAS
ncbi:MAG TPA: hypothetical protein VFA82_00925 [Gaiellaceae bacterium]|nr:hypothetical protein [Gaiellaceae bacterium]